MLEEEFAGPKIKHYFVYLKFFGGDGGIPVLKGGSGDPFYNWTPPFFLVSTYPKGAKSAITPKI